MIEKTDTYLNKALLCNSILLATMLNPSYWLAIFELYFPSCHHYAKQLIQQQYNERKAELACNSNSRAVSPLVASQQEPTNHFHPIDDVNLFPLQDQAIINNELTIYLNGTHKNLPSQAIQCLEWWKVGNIYLMIFIFWFIAHVQNFVQEHCKDFPILALLAKDYLACSATSASVEQCFSAASNICGRDQGSLAPRTIERSVSSHQWLRQGFKANGNFKMAQGIISQAFLESEECKTKIAVDSGSAQP